MMQIILPWLLLGVCFHPSPACHVTISAAHNTDVNKGKRVIQGSPVVTCNAVSLWVSCQLEFTPGIVTSLTYGRKEEKKSVRKEASENLPCLDQGIFVFFCVCLSRTCSIAGFMLDASDSSSVKWCWEPNFIKQIGMGFVSKWFLNPKVILHCKGWVFPSADPFSSFRICEVYSTDGKVVPKPPTQSTVRGIKAEHIAIVGSFSDTSTRKWPSTVWWYQCCQVALTVCQSSVPLRPFSTAWSIMKVLSSPGGATHSNLSSFWLLSVYSICPAALDYLNTWDMAPLVRRVDFISKYPIMKSLIWSWNWKTDDWDIA